MKTFREILAEQDDEFVYLVKSTADIHDPLVFAKVKLALTGFKIRAIMVDQYRPLQKDNPDFPAEPNSALYVVKVTTALPVVGGEQLIAIHARINQAQLLVLPEG